MKEADCVCGESAVVLAGALLSRQGWQIEQLHKKGEHIVKENCAKI